MLFHSPEFLSLLLVTAAAFYAFPRARLYLLALANGVFYGAAGLPWLALFVGMSLLTYVASKRAQPDFGRSARRWVWLGVVANLLNLGFFKYTNLLFQSVNGFLHFAPDGKLLSIVLPIGISFYTFQLVAYLVDVARGEQAPSRSFLEFWVFIAFFAQIIAGPIMRAKDFLPQVERTVAIRFNSSDFKYGVYLLLIGLAKKVILADTIAPLADSRFAAGTAIGGLSAWVAAYLFAFQIYFDFSAYSDMALGIGRLFGYRLTQNFFTPYLSGGPREFWQRWHVTLSTWIRDYVYFPLGGSRVKVPRQLFNLILAMTLSGVWHGAAWTFAAWGLYHGVLAAVERLYRKHVEAPVAATGLGRRVVTSWVYRAASVFAWFHLTVVGWVFFRAPTITQALVMIKHMVLLRPLGFSYSELAMVGFAGLLYVGHALERVVREHEVGLHDAWRRLVPTPARALFYAAAVALVAIFMKGKEAAFIYFRF
ncbi:MAG: MBOAT family O-acyltransferase [Bacillota bacterium]